MYGRDTGMIEGMVTPLNRAARTHAVRAPQAATVTGDTAKSSLQFNGVGANTSRSMLKGDKAWTEAYYSNIWVYRCAQVIAEDLSTLPLRVGPDPTQPGEFDAGHPLAILLGPPPGSPNPETSARSLWLWTIVQRLITGAFAWEIEPDSNGQPMFLWPIPTSAVTPVATNGGNAYFNGYDVKLAGANKTKRLSRDRMLYHWQPSAMDWRSPESVLQAAQLDISVAVMQDRYDYAFLKNDARPATVVVHEAFNNVDERDAWRQSFVSTHGGPQNAGKVAFSETSPNGAKPSESMLIQTLGMSSKDAQMIDRYESKLRAIEVAFGVPRSRLGDASARTFANASEEWKGYWQTTIKTLAAELQDAINTKLAPRFGMDVCWFETSGNELLRPAPPFDPYEGVALLRAGVVSLNEVRTRALYLPKVDGGDELVVMEIADPSTPGAQPVDDPEPTAEVEDVDAVEPEDLPPALTSKTVQRLRLKRDDRGEDREELRERIYREVDRDTEQLEKRWERAWKRHFTKQLESVTSRLEGKRGRQAVRAETPSVNSIFDPIYWERQSFEMAQEMFTDIVDAAFNSYTARFGVALDLESLYATEFIEKRANQLAGRVTETTYSGIKKALMEGVDEGESIPKLAKRIENLFQQTYKNRATVVARTEVISGYNGGTLEAIMNTPADVTAGMQWLAASDERTREWHAQADGQYARVGQSFIVGGENLQYPGDPNGSAENVVMCRCTIIPIAPEDMPKNA